MRAAGLDLHGERDTQALEEHGVDVVDRRPPTFRLVCWFRLHASVCDLPHFRY